VANAVRAGKLESSELAGALGNVLPIASAMARGSMDDVGGAMAALLTRTKGTDAAKSSTQLRSMYDQHP
jgi:hypothetical protein